MAKEKFKELLLEIQNGNFPDKKIDLSQLDEVDILDSTDFINLAGLLKQNPQITELIISYGKINCEIAEIIASMKSLDSIILSEAGLDVESVTWLAQCKLKKLDVSGNDIGNLGAHAFENSVIKDLNLSGCNITGDGATSLFKNPHIQVLSLSCQGISDESLKFLPQNTNLMELDLINNALTEKAMEYVKNNRSLKVLRIGNNNIGDRGMEYCAANTSIEELECTHTQIGDIGAKALAKMPHLKKLTATINNITSEGAIALYGNPALTDLNLNSNKLKKDAIDLYYTGKTHLQHFEFFNNPIKNDSGAKEVKNSKPGLERFSPY